MPKRKVVNVQLAKRALCKKSFYYFVQEFWSVIIAEDPVWSWYIKYMCDVAQDVVERIAKREIKLEDLIVNIPPGSSKSTIWTIMLPAWAWTKDATLRILTISYSDELATEHAVKSRNIIKSDLYRALFPEVKISKDKDNKTNYENSLNGQRIASGLGGSITGMHAHLIIIDDPLNPKQAASVDQCSSASKTIDNTLSTRKVDKSVTVTCLIMQRLGEADPTGHLLAKEGKKIKHIRLPAELKDGPKPSYLAAHYVGGLLDQKRLPAPVLAEALADLGAAGYAGQFAQRPAPAGGLIWQKWFKEVPDENWPDRKHLSQLGTDWDTAYTKDEENAATAYVTAGKIGHNIYLDDFGFAWLEFPEMIKYMKTKQHPHYIEAKASGKSAKSTLNEQGVIAIEIAVKGGTDKIARTQMATPVAEAGFVYVRKSMVDMLYNDSKQGILFFPKGKYADLNDALTQCLQRLGKKGKMNSNSGAEE